MGRATTFRTRTTGRTASPPSPWSTTTQARASTRPATAQQKTVSLKVDFDRQDVKFWFQQLGMHMLSTAGVKDQWTKRLLLHKQLPVDIVAKVKDLLRKDNSEAGATPYRDKGPDSRDFWL